MTPKAKHSSDEIARQILKSNAADWLDEQYIIYALYVIRNRALIGRDGMKPVNRRLVWSMFRDNILPTSQYVKAAQIVGNTTGVFHPHGTAPVAGALARLAQEYSMRVPLVDYMGTVGFVTGDTPASERYWEARMTKAAVELVKESKLGGADMGRNFDGTADEPRELPVRWPVDIINGSFGVAVGFAANMASHNPTEVMDAAIALMKNPGLTTENLLEIMKGPDFPTGGELIGVDGIKDYYNTGVGKFSLRGRYRVEDMTRGRKRIVFYELPYSVSAESVIVKINETINKGGLSGVATVRDSTDRKNGLRLVIETKAGANHLAVLNEVFKKTPAESSMTVRNTVLRDNSPEEVTMLDLLVGFVESRREVLTRIDTKRVDACAARKRQLDALLSALVDVDKAISIIRDSDTAADAKAELQKSFKIDAEGAEYILSMQLRRLTKADSLELQKEKDSLDEEIAAIEKRMNNKSVMDAHIIAELEATKKVIADERRTTITGLTSADAKEEAKAAAKAATAIEKNRPCFITRFVNGALLMSPSEFSYSTDDESLAHGLIAEQIKVNTRDSIVVVLSDGTGRRIPATYVSTGEPSTLSDLGITDTDAELVGIAKNEAGKNDVGLALASANGLMKISKADWPTREEFPVFTLDEGDRIVGSRWLGKSIKATHFVTASSDGNVLVFPAESIRISGSKSGGVRGFKLKDGQTAVGFDWIRSATAAGTSVLTATAKSAKLTPIGEIPTKNKGGQGVAVHAFKKGEEALTGFYVGEAPAMTAPAGDLEQVFPTPPLAAKRGAASTAIPFPVTVGAREVEVL